VTIIGLIYLEIGEKYIYITLIVILMVESIIPLYFDVKDGKEENNSTIEKTLKSDR
jgi:hypothetical protein